MLSGSRNDVAYTIIDVNGDVNDQVKADMEAIEGVIKVRIIK